MIRKISVHQLLPGMYVVDLHRPWLEHRFWRSRFLVHDDETVRRILACGTREITIDTALGIDARAEVSPQARINAVERKLLSLAEQVKSRPLSVSLGEERRRATRLLNEANHTLLKLMELARLGGTVEASRLEPIVSKMIESVRRNPDALVPLARLKQRDHYAGEHAVATAGLIVALGLHLGVAEAEIERLALGALVKDVGELALDNHLTDKPGRLTAKEQSLMHSHVEESLAVLDAPSRLAETTVAVILEHHERFDGSGYPYQRAGEDISLAGRMAAIVDTYDAMTSDRPYRRALSPAIALRQVFEQAGLQFDPALVASFVHTLGVYPVGTLVRLESGHLAVVEEQSPGQPLNPVVRVIYHCVRREYVAPVVVDLSKKVGNHYGKITRGESYEHWGISPLRWQPS